MSGVAAWYAPSDLAALPDDLGTDPTATDTREAQLFGAALSDVPDLVRQASPISYVSTAAPPTLLLHGDADRLIPVAQSERLAAALTALGADVAYETLSDADHMWLGAPDAPAEHSSEPSPS